MSFRVGIVGAGGIGRYHVRHLQKMEDVRIVAVQDAVPATAEQLARELDARAYPSHLEMYDGEELDAVFIGIPPFAHTDQETAAAERGIHIFVQKPPALSMEKAREVEAAAAAAGVVTAVGFQDRYLDFVDAMKAFLAGRQVGLSMGYWLGGIPGVAWWRRKELSGGQAVEQTIHIFDMARDLLGEVEEVYASATTGVVDTSTWEGYDVEDASAVNLKYAGGTTGVIFSACFLAKGVGSPSGLDVYCPDGRLSYRLRRDVTLIEAGQEPRLLEKGNDQNEDCIRAFVAACRAGDPGAVRSPYADAVKTLEITLAANRSLATGAPVRLPL